MAEQIPYGVVVSVINRLGSLTFREIGLIYGVENEMERLKEIVEGIKAVLVDAEQKQQNDQLIKLWISRLKRVLHKADDLLDELQTENLLRKRDGKRKVRDFFSSSNPIAFRLKMAHKIRKIREQFNTVAEDMSKLNLDRRALVMGHNESNSWRETSSKHEENIIGRKKSKKEIIDLLLNTNSNQNVSSVAIVGVGGLGKTTLAQLVYNDAEVKKFFNKQMWVCVSEDFDVKTLVRKILESSIGYKVDDQQLELLQNKLQENLNGQRYLLVLDDIWHEDRQKWLHLRKYLTCGAKGSKILVTTRNEMVAKKMDVTTPYVLKCLTNVQSWALLKRLAFGEDRIMTQNLESIGRKIVEKCAGVPLAIRAMGSMLQSKTDESDWEAILESDFWKLSGDNNDIMPILKLSYDHLSIELRQCFAYCSLYPKDWVYDKDGLIELWMAQGYLECQNEKQCLEDVGDQYVHILLMRSFFQDVQMNMFGEIHDFKMHDLMHDLSRLVAGSDCCLYGEERKTVASHPIHISFEGYNSSHSLDMLDASRLRTILQVKNPWKNDLSRFVEFKRLRSLDLSRGNMRNLPESIGNMKHLRYLDLTHCSHLTNLPKSLSNLVNLQTLKLNGCFKLEFSIDGVTKLINLRRLEIYHCKAFEDGMPIGLDRMTALQSLSNFRVGNDTDKERKKAKLNELKELNLRHTLAIENLSLARDVEGESKDVNLKAKKYLKSLKLDWGYGIEVKNGDSLQLLENLCPHPNLKQLRVAHYPGVRLSGWLLSLTNLVELDIYNCGNCQYLPALDGFLSLKTLRIQDMDALEYICYEGCSSPVVAQRTNFFPSLVILDVCKCKNFRGWQREADVNNRINNETHHSLPQFPCLLFLQIVDCPNLSCMPTFPNLMGVLDLCRCSMKPLIDTLKVSTTGSSATEELNPSLSKVKDLSIKLMDMEALPEEWMQNLTSLQRLSIENLSSLVTLFCQMRHLPASLQSFNIWDMDNLDAWSGDEDVSNSTQCQVLQCLRSLQTISFLSCGCLKALPKWICDLQSLQHIDIRYCGNLESLPEGMHQLTNLQTLHLVDCPLLKERCKRGTGAEWPKIARIPTIVVDMNQI